MASIKDILSISLLEDLKSTEQLDPWVHSHFPFLEQVRADGHRAALSLSGFALEKEGSVSPSTQLLHLLTQGFYPKALFSELYDINSGNCPLNDLIHAMKASRVIFLSVDMDGYRKIFKNKSFWYFIPALCCKISADGDVPFVQRCRDWINIELKLLQNPTTDPFPWLLGLLFEFCFPANIIMSPKICKSNIKEVEMRIDVDRKESKGCITISWPLGVERDRQHAVIQSYCVKEVLETSPILRNMVGEIRVNCKDKGKFNIEEASEKAAKFFECERSKKMEHQILDSMNSDS